LRTLYGADLALIRPDQQIFWRGDACPENFAELIDIATGRVLEVAGGTVRGSSVSNDSSWLNIRGVRYRIEECSP
jgi:hypothetical protein